MNQRIQELIKQATHVEEPDGLFLREVFDQAKFAELMVRECALMCLEDRDSQRILEHFGVEP